MSTQSETRERDARGAVVLRFERLGRNPGPYELVIRKLSGSTMDDIAESIYRAVKKAKVLAARFPDVECALDEEGRLIGAVYSGFLPFPFVGPVIAPRVSPLAPEPEATS